ncbi:cytochrome P450 [Lineolata rhizophorae]|uniref:Cytochrome P450 n=1 Tax=Lineolata rhizophorae TaxID=578093 RepID=A0A6A6NL85_9PEZI|nr:cytochrome P450 [Lineolata rhizophorae]
MARFAVRSPDPKRDMDPRALCSRLLALNFVGIHTSAVTIQNFWLDVLGRPGKEELLTALRKEAEEVQAKCGGAWNKANVARLALLDSTLRESLRVSAFKGRGVERQVVAEKGTTLPDGTVLPKGTRLGVATTEVHADCELHGNDANVFRPDRFVGKGGTGGVIVTGESFLAFGLGRHACPGRFLAAHELKLLIAYMLLNYDIAPLRCRPENSSFSDFSAPLNVLLRIRPRRDARLE